MEICQCDGTSESDRGMSCVLLSAVSGDVYVGISYAAILLYFILFASASYDDGREIFLSAFADVEAENSCDGSGGAGDHYGDRRRRRGTGDYKRAAK